MLPDTNAHYDADSYILLDVKENPKCRYNKVVTVVQYQHVLPAQTYRTQIWHFKSSFLRLLS